MGKSFLDKEELSILKDDLEVLLSKVDFAHYNPLSKEFQAALSVASLIALADDTFFKDYEKHEAVEHEECSETVKDRIEDELKDSCFYLDKYKEICDKRFLLLAKDELRHAETIAAIHNTACCDDAINEQRVAIDSAR